MTDTIEVENELSDDDCGEEEEEEEESEFDGLTAEEVAKKLHHLKTDHKEFRKCHKAIFDENRDYNKRTRSAKKKLQSKMVEQGVTLLTVDGIEFEVKTKTTVKHGEDGIRKHFPEISEDQLNAYITANTKSSTDVATRRQKRRRVDEEDL